MGIDNKLADNLDEVDIIIAGGGTAGCIIAGRLAESDPDLSILLIEGGANNKDVASIVHPVLYLQNLLPATQTALFYQANQAKQLADRECIVPSGGTLGGGSSINFMMYTRAQGSDFDAWNTPGWSADEMRPFLNRLETYHGPGDTKDHGQTGPIHVSDGGFRAKVPEDDFIRAAKEVGFPEIQDLQNLESNNGFQRWLRYVGPDGKRQDTAHRYLHPKLDDETYLNLHVLVESKVVRVLFDANKRATGVEYIPNPAFQPQLGLTSQPAKSVRARKLVVMACGACGTPPVLERSGLGDRQILERAGVPLVEELPGVGKDYQDHHLLLYPYKTNLKADETIDGVLSGRKEVSSMLEANDKMLGWNGIDVAAKIRPTEKAIQDLGPEFRAAWDKDFKNQPNRPLMLCGLINGFLGDASTVPAGQYVTIGTYTAYPYSRGHIHITGASPADPLDFALGFFTDPHDLDLKKQLWAYKLQRDILRRTRFYRGELAQGHPDFPPGSAAAVVDSLDAPLEHVEDIAYTPEDDAAIEQWLRQNVNTTWHSLGTCKMAPRHKDGVVDSALSVYGVERLKVADLSIPPENVGANTNNTALVIGEKAADIIISELRARAGPP